MKRKELTQELLAIDYKYLPNGKVIDTLTEREVVEIFERTVEARDNLVAELNVQINGLYAVCFAVGVKEEILREMYKDLKGLSRMSV